MLSQWSAVSSKTVTKVLMAKSGRFCRRLNVLEKKGRSCLFLLGLEVCSRGIGDAKEEKQYARQ
jgi:hypothetical protein